MSPSVLHSKVTPPYQRPNLYIHGIGVEYPPYEIKPEHVETLARRFYPSTPA
jgi:type III polyketide synthase